MRSYNYEFKSFSDLEGFIEKKGINGEVLVQIFSGVIEEGILKVLVDFLKRKIENVKIIATTTDGEIVDGKINLNSIVLNFLVLEKSRVRTIASCEVNEINKKILKDTKVVIIFADGLNCNGEDIVNSINKEVVIAGGFAADGFRFEKTLVFNEKRFVQKGYVAAFIDGDVKVKSGFALNWRGIGRFFKVTKAHSNRVYELDNTPIIDIYKRYFGDVVDKYLLEIGIEFPLLTKRDMSIARAVVGKKDNTLIFAGNLYEGELVQFGYANIEDILIQDFEMFNRLHNQEVEALFVYECASRRRFFSSKKVEYEYLPLKNISFSGFFTYGEFFGKEKKYFFNQTITYLALSEGSKIFTISEFSMEDKDMIITKGLTNLIKSATQDLIEANERFKELAIKDGLTGIYNRKGCKEALEEIGCNYSLILIDIDFFKKVNDTYGHDKGDFVLKELSYLISAHIRKSDVFCRFGGEEFVLILPNTEYEDALIIAEKLRKLIEEHDFDGIKVTISLGVSKGNISFENTFKEADNRLYLAKENGRNRVM